MNKFQNVILQGTEYADRLGGPDSDLWIELFIQADRVNPDLAQRLMYLRNTGCRLHRSEQFGYVIKPVVELWERSGVVYEVEKQYLNNYRDDVIRILRGLRK